MRKLILIIYLISYLLLAVGNQCGAAIYDGAGTWSFALTNNWINGVCYWNRPLDGSVVVTQTGDSVQVVDNYNGATYLGSANGTNYNISGSYPDVGGTTTITINVTLTSNTSCSGSWTVH